MRVQQEPQSPNESTRLNPLYMYKEYKLDPITWSRRLLIGLENQYQGDRAG